MSAVPSVVNSMRRHGYVYCVHVVWKVRSQPVKPLGPSRVRECGRPHWRLLCHPSNEFYHFYILPPGDTPYNHFCEARSTTSGGSCWKASDRLWRLVGGAAFAPSCSSAKSVADTFLDQTASRTSQLNSAESLRQAALKATITH